MSFRKHMIKYSLIFSILLILFVSMISTNNLGYAQGGVKVLFIPLMLTVVLKIKIIIAIKRMCILKLMKKLSEEIIILES